MADPRVWFNGDDVPAGVFTYRVQHTGAPEDRIQMFDAYEEVGNGNYGPLVEIVIPDDLDGIVARAAKARTRLVCISCSEELEENEVGSRAGDVAACHGCADHADAPA